MRSLIESDGLPAPPKWKSAQIILSELPSQPQTLYYRDIHEVIDHLFGNPTFAGSTDYAPRRIFEAGGKRIFHEFYTGDGWWEAQASGTLLGGLAVTLNDALLVDSSTAGIDNYPYHSGIG